MQSKQVVSHTFIEENKQTGHFMGNSTALWSEVLSNLRSQMTEVTFDTWLRDSQCVEASDGHMVVAVKNAYAVDWLTNRLGDMIARTVERAAGQALAVEFVVVEAEAPVDLPTVAREQARFKVPAFDVSEAGWFPVSEYECRFWAALLGRVAWRVWELVRKADRRKEKSDWTPPQRWTAPSLAEQVPCGKQALVGAERKVAVGIEGAWLDTDGIWRYHKPGAFDRLEEEQAGRVERRGEKRHTTYWISVRVGLGLLEPRQVNQLPARLQVQHDRWLEDHGFNPRDWDDKST